MSFLRCREGMTFYRSSVLINEVQNVNPGFLTERETCYVLLYYTAIKGRGNITILQI